MNGPRLLGLENERELPLDSFAPREQWQLLRYHYDDERFVSAISFMLQLTWSRFFRTVQLGNERRSCRRDLHHESVGGVQ